MRKRIGIFGGSFNPFHKGHLNNVLHVARKTELDKVLIVPAYQTPHKTFIEEPSPIQRLEIAQLGCLEYTDILQVDHREVERKDVSYTITTLKQLNKEGTDLFLIIGLDLFYHFDSWKDYEEILQIANLIVTSRPNWFFPESLEQFPKGLQSHVKDFGFQKTELKSGKNIEFVQIEKDIDVSSTYLRRRIQRNKSTFHYLDLKVEEYIKEHQIYQKTSKEDEINAKQLTIFCKKVLDDKKAVNIKAFYVSPISSITDYTLIASGMSRKHTQSLSEILIQDIKDHFCISPINVEGITEGNWVLVDYGFLIVHIFYNYIRDKYQLESLWDKAALDL